LHRNAVIHDSARFIVGCRRGRRTVNGLLFWVLRDFIPFEAGVFKTQPFVVGPWEMRLRVILLQGRDLVGNLFFFEVDRDAIQSDASLDGVLDIARDERRN
jgi:hypothetical protein